MKYTVRFAHMESMTDIEIGAIIKRGDVIGKMGTSGSSTAPHLHIDCAVGMVVHLWRMSEMEAGEIIPAYSQLCYFIDDELFAYPIVITFYFNDIGYFKSLKKAHMGFDVVPEDRHDTAAHYWIHWTRSKKGILLAKGYDSGYGNYVMIQFEA